MAAGLGIYRKKLSQLKQLQLRAEKGKTSGRSGPAITFHEILVKGRKAVDNILKLFLWWLQSK